jgi:hypothetical protein
VNSKNQPIIQVLEFDNLRISRMKIIELNICCSELNNTFVEAILKSIFMRKFTLLTMLALVFQASIAQTNTNISNSLLFSGEPYLAINPTNNQNLVCAWMSLNFAGGQYQIAIKTRASFDGGNTWNTALSLPHFGTGFGSADVSMAFNKNGVLFLSYIDYKRLPDSGGVYVARSLNGGISWDAPSKVFDMYDVANKRPIDRPWLVVDNTSSNNAGTLYITTKPAPWITPPNRNYFKVSIDSGYTWTNISTIDGGNYLVGNLIAQPMAAPAIMEDGNFCAVYPSFVTSQNILPTYYFAKSSNKGQTFNYSTVIAAQPFPIDTNLKSAYRLIANPINSNQLLFLLPSNINGDADIMALSSTNAGQTWSNMIRVNDDAIGNGKAQDMIWASYNKQGKLVVTWRDRRLANTNGFWNAGYDFYYATSVNNGQTFSPNQKLTSQFIAFDSVITQNGNDAMCNVYEEDTLYSIWGDTRDGKMNIYFSKTIASTNTNVAITMIEGSESQWKIFPNPVNDFISIDVPTIVLKEEILIYDIYGHILAKETINTVPVKMNVQQFSKGIYFIKIGNEVRQFIKE